MTLILSFSLILKIGVTGQRTLFWYRATPNWCGSVSEQSALSSYFYIVSITA